MVKELDNETAATIQGGWDLIAYDGFYGTGNVIGKYNIGDADLPTERNNKISSVKINGGRWKLYDGFNYKGASTQVLTKNKPGEVWNLVGFNNKTSSLRDFTG